MTKCGFLASLDIEIQSRAIMQKVSSPKITSLFPLILLFGLMLCASCGRETKEEQNQVSQEEKKTEALSPAQKIIRESIRVHGGDLYKNAKVSFVFRERSYSYLQEEGKYRYERIFKDSAGQHIEDILSNDGFERKIEAKTSEVAPEMQRRYANSINSVMYFTFLPFKLQDPAVRAEYLGTGQIHAEPYEKVKVTFASEGGGEDYQDIFIYWFHQEKHTLDYLAYSYETDGGGVRFRESRDRQNREGLVFQNYNNYKAPKEVNIETLDSLFEAGELEMLSEIVNEIQSVEILAENN
ncbi:MAG: DUF6503 family protein [Bacteroidota bacterium]